MPCFNKTIMQNPDTIIMDTYDMLLPVYNVYHCIEVPCQGSHLHHYLYRTFYHHQQIEQHTTVNKISIAYVLLISNTIMK